MRNVRLSTDHCFSVLQHATHTIVVLGTAWPWPWPWHKLIRARSYGLIVLQTVASGMLQSQYRGAGYCLALGLFACILFVRINLCAQDHTLLFPSRDSYGVLTANKSEPRALSKGCRRWCWCCGPGCWCCELAERARLRRAAALVGPLPVLSAGKARRCWCQLVVRAVEVP